MFRSCFQLCHHTLTVTSRKVLCRNSVLTMKSLLMLYPYMLHTGCINARKIFALYFALKMMHSLLCDGRCRKINHLHEITLESMQWSTTESKKKKLPDSLLHPIGLLGCSLLLCLEYWVEEFGCNALLPLLFYSIQSIYSCVRVYSVYVPHITCRLVHPQYEIYCLASIRFFIYVVLL